MRLAWTRRACFQCAKRRHRSSVDKTENSLFVREHSKNLFLAVFTKQHEKKTKTPPKTTKHWHMLSIFAHLPVNTPIPGVHEPIKMPVNTPKNGGGFREHKFHWGGRSSRPTDRPIRPGYVPHLGGGAKSITGQSFCSCDLALLRSRRPNTEVVSRTACFSGACGPGGRFVGSVTWRRGGPPAHRPSGRGPRVWICIGPFDPATKPRRGCLRVVELNTIPQLLT